MRVEYSSLELVHSREHGDVGYVEVTSAREYPVKTFSSLLNGGCSAYGSVLSDSDGEVVSLFVELNGVDDSVEMNPVKDIGLLDATNDVVFEDFVEGKRG